MKNIIIIQIGLIHAIIRDITFLCVYNLFDQDRLIETKEMILSLLIPSIITPLIISKIFKINILIPMIISFITIIIPNFMPNMIFLTHYENIKNLIIPFGISILSYTILYFFINLFKPIK